VMPTAEPSTEAEAVEEVAAEAGGTRAG
jgi:hypothetical protein